MRMRLGEAAKRWTLAALALAAIVDLYRQWWHVNVTTVALTLLLYVLVLASQWELYYAVTFSVAATVCYNYFFLPPLNTFTINDPQNWVALFALLFTAVTASRLSTRARREAAEARGSQRELEILFRLSSELLQTDSLASLLRSVPRVVVAATGADGAALRLLDGAELFEAGEPGDTTALLSQLEPVRATEGDRLLIPVRSGVRLKGLLQLRGVVLMPATAEALGKLVAVSLDRAQALEQAAREEAGREGERLRAWMIDSVTHELRTPLTSIKGAATALLQTEGGTSRELLMIIDEESDRLNRLVSEAVEVARLDAREVQLRPDRVLLSAVVADARERCAWVESEHTLTTEIPDDLWVWADAHMLGRVLINLVENAAKYAPAGSPIELRAYAETHAARLEVVDRGPGIAVRERELVFERFYRGTAAKAGAAGTGMGLAISRAIMIAHGGGLALQSREGGGSIFSLTVPREAPRARARSLP
jgi:two-component system, OmpR family, sensor histidine kinase KdpD